MPTVRFQAPSRGNVKKEGKSARGTFFEKIHFFHPYIRIPGRIVVA